MYEFATVPLPPTCIPMSIDFPSANRATTGEPLSPFSGLGYSYCSELEQEPLLDEFNPWSAHLPRLVFDARLRLPICGE